MIAYSFGVKSNHLNIIEMNVQSRQMTQVTSGGLGDDTPSFSPDGRSLIFVRCTTGTCHLIVRDENGTEQPLLPDITSWRPAWCRNPAKPWIIFENHSDGGKTNIWMIDLNTRESQRLTNGGNDRRPDWSPDCSRFVFLRSTASLPAGGGKIDDLFISDVDTKSELQLTHTPDADEWPARWSPDEEWLVYSRFRDTDGNGFINTDLDMGDLMIIRSDGTDMQALTDGNYRPLSPSFSPDGTKILFASWIEKNVFQLVIYDRALSSFSEITGKGTYHNPVWGP